MLIYVTGVPGTGKSTVRQALLERGYESHDVDEGFAATYNKDTGQRVNEAEVVRTRAWHENNEWLISLESVRELAEQTKDRIAFLCGVARNDTEVLDVFSRVVALDVDETTLQDRLSGRSDRFGTAQEELELALEWQQAARTLYKDLGIPVVDTSMPIDAVVENILRLVK